jgi:hypothetical protein
MFIKGSTLQKRLSILKYLPQYSITAVKSFITQAPVVVTNLANIFDENDNHLTLTVLQQ